MASSNQPSHSNFHNEIVFADVYISERSSNPDCFICVSGQKDFFISKFSDVRVFIRYHGK